MSEECIASAFVLFCWMDVIDQCQTLILRFDTNLFVVVFDWKSCSLHTVNLSNKLELAWEYHVKMFELSQVHVPSDIGKLWQSQRTTSGNALKCPPSFLRQD